MRVAAAVCRFVLKTSPTTRGWRFYVVSGGATVGFIYEEHGVGSVSTPTTYATGTFYHVVVVKIAGSVEIFVNGASVAGPIALGAFTASFVLIPRLGLVGSLILASTLNLIVGTTFVLNRLRHTIHHKEPIEEIPNRFGVGALYLYTLVSGTVTLSLEVLFVRVLNLTIGAGPHNFAVIVGVSEAAAATDPTVHTPVPDTYVPCVVVSDTYVTPVGNRSVRVTPVAPSGPQFVRATV